MTIKILGNTAPTRRVVTKLYSFDRAFMNHKGEIGFPVGKFIEVFGPTHVGKSTITIGLAGIIANALKTDITLADFEGFDPEFLVAILESLGFDGTVNCIYDKKDEDILDAVLQDLNGTKFGVAIVDSLAAISPIGEVQGNLEDANMGARAKLLAKFSRAVIKILRDDDHSKKTNPKTIFGINHMYPNIGSRGNTTPGGEVKNYLAAIRIQLKRRYFKNKWEEFPDGSYILEGTVVKNRCGYKGRTFHLFSLAGKGIHLGLTAMYDGIQLGVVDKSKSIKIGEQTFGYMKDIVKEAQSGNEEFFTPFFTALNNIQMKGVELENELENTEDTANEELPIEE